MLTNNVNDAAMKKDRLGCCLIEFAQTGKKYLYCYLSGRVMVTIENQGYSNETHCDQATGIT